MRPVSWYGFCYSHICDSQDSDLENPFPAGTIVTGDDFANRRDEVAFLREELRQGAAYSSSPTGGSARPASSTKPCAGSRSVITC